jgi:hypothetical protein
VLQADFSVAELSARYLPKGSVFPTTGANRITIAVVH